MGMRWQILKVETKDTKIKPYRQEIKVYVPESGWEFTCSNCLNRINRSDNYCSQCGREIDWSNEG